MADLMSGSSNGGVHKTGFNNRGSFKGARLPNLSKAQYTSVPWNDDELITVVLHKNN